MTEHAGAEAGIHALLDEHAAAHTARDAERVLGLYLPGAVASTLAPPLQQGPAPRTARSRDSGNGSPRSTDRSA